MTVLRGRFSDVGAPGKLRQRASILPYIQPFFLIENDVYSIINH